MFFDMGRLYFNLSLGLDAVEDELFGRITGHGKRIAILTTAMGKHMNCGTDEIITMGAVALLHDNALGQSFMEMEKGIQPETLKNHCIIGEKNISTIPFPTDVTGMLKYHHERADGLGPFKMNAENTPLCSQFIALSDSLDIENDFDIKSESELHDLHDIIRKRAGTQYTHTAADAMLGILDSSMLKMLHSDNIDSTVIDFVPPWNADIDSSGLMGIGKTLSAITDNKSKFTAKHSTQIANRAYYMAGFYGFDKDTCARIYIAAALHDVGKLLTPIEILEKPGKLNDEEFEVIKKHAYWSYILLKDVKGLEEVCRWAVTHHRKLNGGGYPDLPEEYLDMDFVSRMMACIDIYQAVRETRPYHSGRTHEETMAIMGPMADRGEIDKKITEDMDREMARFPGAEGDVPNP